MSAPTPNTPADCSLGEVLCPKCKRPARGALMSAAAFCMNPECDVILIDLNSPASSGVLLSNDVIEESLRNTPAEKHQAVWTLIGRDAEQYEKEANE